MTPTEQFKEKMKNDGRHGVYVAPTAPPKPEIPEEELRDEYGIQD